MILYIPYRMITPQINELDIIVVSYWITYIYIKFAEDDLTQVNNDPPISKFDYESEVSEILNRRGNLIERLDHFERQYNLYTRQI